MRRILIVLAVIIVIILISIYPPMNVFTSNFKTESNADFKHQHFNTVETLSEVQAFHDSLGIDFKYMRINKISDVPVRIVPFGEDTVENAISVFFKEIKRDDNYKWKALWQEYAVTQNYEYELPTCHLGLDNKYIMLRSEGTINLKIDLSINGLCSQSKADKLIQSALDSAMTAKIEKEIRKELLKYSKS